MSRVFAKFLQNDGNRRRMHGNAWNLQPNSVKHTVSRCFLLFLINFDRIAGETSKFHPFSQRIEEKHSVFTPISRKPPPRPPFSPVFPAIYQRSGKSPRKPGRGQSFCENPKIVPRRACHHGARRQVCRIHAPRHRSRTGFHKKKFCEDFSFFPLRSPCVRSA